MKARVKATGEIVEIIDIDFDTLFCNNGGHYTLEHLEGIECDPDYWTRLEHQYAGMAMQGMLANANHYLWERKQNSKSLAANAAELAHALVEKLKEKEGR